MRILVVGTGGVGGYFGGLLINGTIGPLSAVLLLSGPVDLQPPAAPNGLSVTTEDSMQLRLAWEVVDGAAGYNLYRGPLSGGGWQKLNSSPLLDTSFTDTGLRNAVNYYYVVTALDSLGNESPFSGQASGLPHYVIGWANLQWPPALNHTISTINRTGNVYGQVWIDGQTSTPGATPTLQAQLGYGPDGSDPAGNAAWTGVDAAFNVDAGNNDEFKASLLPGIVHADGRLRVSRRFQMVRTADCRTLLRALVHYVCIDLETGKPRRMPAAFARYRPLAEVEAALAREAQPFAPGVEPRLEP